MSEQRPCRVQVGDRVIYGGDAGCYKRYEGYEATVTRIGRRTAQGNYTIFLRFDPEVRGFDSEFGTYDFRVQPLCVAPDIDAFALL